jgi:hypothetical protein
VPFAMFCMTSLTLTATVWWAAAMQWLPTTLGLALALYFFTGYAERPNARDLWGSLAAVALGLFFFEKALTIPAALALLAVLYFAPGPLWKRPWRAFRRYVVFWAAHLALAGGYLWLYLARVDVEASSSRPTPAGDYVELVRIMIFDTYLPSLLGGPLDWFSTPETSLVSWADPPAWLAWLTAVLTLALVLATSLLIRGAWRAWALLAVFLAVSVTLVARVRLGLVGPFIGRDHRYLTDAALLGSVCLALATIPLRDGLDRAMRHVRDPDRPVVESWPEPDPDEDGTGPEYVVEDEDEPDDRPADTVEAPRAGMRWFFTQWRRVLIWRWRTWSAAHRSWLLGGGALLVALVTVGGLLSSEQYLKTWEENPAPEYFANLETGLRDPSRPKPVFMFDQQVPPLIMAPEFGSGRMFSHVLKVYGSDAPVFGWWSPRFLVADAEGKLHPGAVAGSTAVPPRSLVCSQEAQPAAGVSVTMPSPPPQWDWKVEITYSADQDTPARVAYGQGRPVPVQLRKGLNVVVVAASGAGPAVSLTDLGAGAVVCVGKVTVGNPVPAPDSTPGSP